MRLLRITAPLTYIALCLSLFAPLSNAAPGDVVSTLTINNVSGDGRTPMTYDGIVAHDGYYWVLDWGTDRIYRVYPEDVFDPDSGALLFSAGDSDFNIPVEDNPGSSATPCNVDYAGQICGGGGLTFAENYLWNASPITDDIIKIDPVDGDNLESENVLANLTFPSTAGIAYDGTFFWVTDWQTNSINKVSPIDGSFISAIPGPSSLPSYADNPSVTNANLAGITWDGRALWVTDTEEDMIYRVDPTDGSILNFFSAPGTNPKGLSWDGELLLHVDRNLNQIYKIDSGIIPFGIIGCLEKNGVAIDGDVILSQTAIPDQSTTTDIDGCFNFASFTSGVPLQVKVSETGLDEKPVITLTEPTPGDSSVTLIVGDTYSEPGYVANDTEDGDISINVVATPDVINTPSLIDTSAPNPGGVQVAYDVIDSAGNAADTVYRTVYVLNVDTTAPTITLLGDNPTYVEQGDTYTEAGATASDDRDGDISANVTVTGTVNPNVAGSYTLSYNVSDSTGNAATTVTRTVIVQDTTIPVITLLGTTPYTHERGDTYTDAGATANDNIDGIITGSIVTSGSVSANTSGSYVLNYNVSDSSGNAAVTVSRTVDVTDTTAPVITLIGANPINHELNTSYTDPGVTASDYPGDDLTSSVVVSGSVNTTIAGTYTLTYDLTDVAGNVATSITRDVIVSDTGAPAITLLGDNPLAHELGSPYTDPGATADDVIDGNLTSSIVVAGDVVNPNLTGTYNVTYDVVDSAGNPAPTQTRVVNVSDTTPPLITLTGSANVLHELGTAYTDAGATASDNTDGVITGSIVVTGLPIDTNTAGTYTITYNVNDAAGNAAAPVTRIVEVADRTAPVITLTGANPINHEVNTVYIDPGATANDNIDNDITGNIGVSGSVNANVIGTYTLTYNVQDSSGNAAATVTRTVNVVDTGAPTITIAGDNPVNHELNTPYTDAGASADDAADGDISGSIVTVNNVNTTVAGSYTVTYDVTDSQGNPATQQVRTVNVADYTAPVITLNGSATVNHEQGTVYTDAGATASDIIDGNLNASIVTVNNVNASVPGTYTITYDVSDAAGNAATTVTRTVVVSDTTPPVITLIGANPINHEVDTVYTDPGATASDNIDNDISGSIGVSGSVNANVLGTYTLTYNVQDSSGNAATTVTRTVNVVDTGAPTITIQGNNPVNHELNTTYTDAGATADDAADGDISGSIVTVNNVNTTIAGTYTVTYDVTDSQGNPATQAVRTVNVADFTAPVITLTGSSTVNHEQGTVYTDAGATASDNIDGSLTSSIATVNNVNSNVAGTYTVTYNVSDAAGNAANTITRTVIVSDTTPPVISLVGADPLNHEVGQVYVDPGATASDNIDGSLTSSISVTGSVNANVVGTYILTYNVSDSAGNPAASVTRTINVADTGAPVITITGANPLNHEINTAYVDPGATANDGLDGNITGSIVTVNNVVDTVAGTYTVTYDVTDSNSNPAAQKVRTVNVGDFTPPVITLQGSATVNVEQGTSYTDAGATANDNVDGILTSSIVKTGTVAPSTAGTYIISYNVSDAAGNAATQVNRTVIVADTTPPTITLVGASTINHEQGTAFSDPGVNANDNIDGNISSNVVVSGSVNVNSPGTYTLTYNVSDAAGNNAATTTRTVIVADTVAPVISLVDSDPYNHEQGTVFTDPGATASDIADGNLTGSIIVSGTVNANTAGTYTLTYNVSDAAGNAAAPVTRDVIVADTIAPIITLTGNDPINHEQGTTYTDPGATANDSLDGNLTGSIVVTGTVNTNVAGTYTLSYNVSDAAGNAATTVTRDVIVADTIAPVLTLLGDSSVDHPVGQIYVDAGASASDSFEGDISGSIIQGGTFDQNTVGIYTLTYNASDSAGNAATQITRTVNVVNPSVVANEVESETLVGVSAASAPETGFTGSGYVPLSASGYIEYTFTGYAIPYDLTLRYASTELTAVNVEIILNGVSQGNISLPSTGGLSAWTDSAALTLTPLSGSNTLRINITGASATNIDAATLTPQ